MNDANVNSTNIQNLLDATQAAFNDPDYELLHEHDKAGLVAGAMMLNAIAILDRIAIARPLQGFTEDFLLTLWLYQIVLNWSNNFLKDHMPLPEKATAEEISNMGMDMVQIVNDLTAKALDYYEMEDSVDSRQKWNYLHNILKTFELLTVAVGESDSNDADRYDRFLKITSSI